jgi:hypothetical protein
MKSNKQKKEAYKKGIQAYKDGLSMKDNYYLMLRLECYSLASYWDKGYIHQKNNKELNLTDFKYT